jgi:arabinose-5-phosphate isomerase
VPVPLAPVRTEASRHEGDLRAARRVLDYAGEALKFLSDSLDETFTRAVDVLAGVKGRAVVSGMGKSGHVARKIAATLSSTGTPAQFVHPAEASHGDLGVMTRADALLMLSNSGETPELSALITHARRNAIQIIGVASNADSALLQSADVALQLPRIREACPIGLAPTTSTTLMLALGDALAVALMERKGFSTDQFRELHPGGALGNALIRVLDLMHEAPEIPLVREDTPMSEAVRVISQRRFGCAGVTDEFGRLIGVITDGDLRRHFSPELPAKKARDVMTKNPKVAAPLSLAVEAVAHMSASSITTLFVVAPDDPERRPIGILHIHDCLRAGLR